MQMKTIRIPLRDIVDENDTPKTKGGKKKTKTIYGFDIFDTDRTCGGCLTSGFLVCAAAPDDKKLVNEIWVEYERFNPQTRKEWLDWLDNEFRPRHNYSLAKALYPSKATRFTWPIPVDITKTREQQVDELLYLGTKASYDFRNRMSKKTQLRASQ